MSSLTALARRIDRQTPPQRDRALDGYRALALIGVIVGHWLVGGLVAGPDGLHIASPLNAMPSLAPVSWVLQMLGIFFLVGGFASARSWQRAQASGVTYRQWLGKRLARLAKPVIGLAAVWSISVALIGYLGAGPASTHTAIMLVIQPLWYIGIYLVLTAFTAPAVAASRRYGLVTILPLVVIVAAVDLLRYGPTAAAIPSALAWINIVVGWLIPYQLGAVWGLRGISKRTSLIIAGMSTALFALLLLRFGYPASMVGIPGQGRVNSHPPSLLAIALAGIQCGIAVAAHDRVEIWLRRPLLWAGAVAVNLAAMTILCWHQVASIMASLTADGLGRLAGFGAVPGLTTAPTTTGWVVARLVLLPLLGAMLVGLCAAFRRFDGPWTFLTGPGRAVTVGLAVLAPVTAFALL